MALPSMKHWRGFMAGDATAAASPSTRRRPQIRLNFDNLEDRKVPSGAGLHIGIEKVAASVSALGGRGPARGGDRGGFKVDLGIALGDTLAYSRGSSSLLSQDVRAVQKAYQTFVGSYSSAVAALRRTATTTTAPTQAGLDAFNTSIEAAITTLNTSISTALANLPNTGAGLTATLQGYTATLQTNIESAATGLENSTNRAVLDMNREVGGYLRTALNQSTTAILSVNPTGSITNAAVKTYNQAARTAYSAFLSSLTTAVQASISGGTALDSSAVNSAVSTLKTSLDSAIAGLGTGFTSSSSNPTATVDAALDSLATKLTAIAAPTASNTASARVFVKAVSGAVFSGFGTVNKAVQSAVVAYNNSLL